MKHYLVSVNGKKYDVRANAYWVAVSYAVHSFKAGSGIREIDKETKKPYKVKITMYRDLRLEKLAKIDEMATGNPDDWRNTQKVKKL